MLIFTSAFAAENSATGSVKTSVVWVGVASAAMVQVADCFKRCTRVENLTQSEVIWPADSVRLRSVCSAEVDSRIRD